MSSPDLHLLHFSQVPLDRLPAMIPWKFRSTMQMWRPVARKATIVVPHSGHAAHASHAAHLLLLCVHGALAWTKLQEALATPGGKGVVLARSASHHVDTRQYAFSLLSKPRNHHFPFLLVVSEPIREITFF
jgi:hypothetical protein